MSSARRHYWTNIQSHYRHWDCPKTLERLMQHLFGVTTTERTFTAVSVIFFPCSPFYGHFYGHWLA